MEQAVEAEIERGAAARAHALALMLEALAILDAGGPARVAAVLSMAIEQLGGTVPEPS